MPYVAIGRQWITPLLSFVHLAQVLPWPMLPSQTLPKQNHLRRQETPRAIHMHFFIKSIKPKLLLNHSACRSDAPAILKLGFVEPQPKQLQKLIPFHPSLASILAGVACGILKILVSFGRPRDKWNSSIANYRPRSREIIRLVASTVCPSICKRPQVNPIHSTHFQILFTKMEFNPWSMCLPVISSVTSIPCVSCRSAF